MPETPVVMSPCSDSAHVWWPDEEDCHHKCPVTLGKFQCCCPCHKKKRRVRRTA